MDDDQTRPLNQARRGAPQQYPSPYAGYVSQEQPPEGHPTSGAYGGPGSEPQWDPFDAYSSSYDDEDARPPRRGKTGWLIPVVIVLLGVVAFGAVMMLLSRGPGHDGTTAGPSVAQLSPSSRASASQAEPSQETTSQESSEEPTPVESSSEESSSEEPTPSDTTTSSAAAEFPADTTTACLGGTISDADVKIRNGSGSSCAYVSAIKSQVLAHLAENPQAAVFTVSPYSVSRREYVPLSCSRSRADHLTRCTGGRNVDAYVKDRVG